MNDLAAPDLEHRLLAEDHTSLRLWLRLLTTTIRLEDTVRQLVAVTCNRHSRLLALHGEVYRRHHRRLDFLALMQRSVARYVGTTSWEGWVLELLQRHPTSLDPQSLREAAFLVAGAIIELTARAVDLEPEWLSSATFQEQLVRLLLAYVQPAAGTANPNA